MDHHITVFFVDPEETDLNFNITTAGATKWKCCLNFITNSKDSIVAHNPLAIHFVDEKQLKEAVAKLNYFLWTSKGEQPESRRKED